MTITATAAKGIINIMLEGSNGEQQLLVPTAVSATMTGITAPTGSTGMRFHLRLSNWTASGTITINGTGTPNNSEVFSVAAPTAQQTQSPQLANFEVTSANAYTAITNITTTGLTNGVLEVLGIQAGKFQAPGTMVSDRDPKTYSPNEHSGLMEMDKKILQLTNATSIDSLTQDVYADISLWWPYMMMGAPTSTASIPATPTSLFSAASISASQSLSTQPTAPGMKLIFTITNFTVAGTLTIAGTSYGVATTENISITANGTYYSQNVYSAVNASGITNASTAATMAITGAFGWQLTFKSGAALYTAAIEWFDGTGSWTHPFSMADEGTFDVKVNGEGTVSIKGKAQDKLPIGDRTTTPLSGVNRIAALGTNLNDIPIAGWQGMVYLDPITGTPLTTQYTNMQELKITLKVPQDAHYTFTNRQTFNRAYPGKRQALVESTIDFTDLVQYEQFRQNLKQYLVFQFLGPYIGTDSGTIYSKSWTWTVPFKYDGKIGLTSDPKTSIVTIKPKFTAEYDSGIGGSYKLVVITQQPPTYPS
jgi:hypothetical protein